MTQPLHNGQKLSVELAKRPTLFPSLCIELVKAGEESGQLEKMLEACRQYLDGMHQTEQAIKVATIYPRVVAVLGIIMAVGLSVLVRWVQAHVPYSEEANKVAVEPALRTFASVAKDLGLLVGVAIGAFLAWRILSLAAPFRWAFDTLKMNLPWVAAVTARLVYSRFGKTLATCYSAGLPMTRSVELASDACGNVAVGGSLKRAVPALQSGAKLSEALTAAVRLPPTVMQVIATGERTGRLDETLTQAAEIFDREAQAGSRTMAVLTGLLALLVLAGIIGAVYIGFMKTYYEGLLNAFSE
jgi:type II secretory pathway component PulF